MFDQIYNDQDLFSILRQECRENDVGATVAEKLLVPSGELNHERVIVLKLDSLYSSQNMHNPPPAPDYLVVVRCCDGSYEGYIIELRDTGQTGAVRASKIVPKFKTAINDFIEVRYRHLFFVDNQIIFKKLKLYLVADPLSVRSKGLSEDEYKRRIRGTTLDAYSNLTPISLGGRYFIIEPVLPDPVIEACDGDV